LRRGAGSIQWQLAWRLGLLFVIVFFGAGALDLFRFRAGDLEVPTRLVQGHVRELVDALRTRPDGSVSLELDGGASFDYVVRRGDGTVLFASPGAATVRLAPVPPDWDAGFYRDDDPDGAGSLFGAYRRLTTSAGVIVVQVAEADTRRQLEIRGFLDELLGEAMPVLLPFMLATLVIGILTIRHGLAPLAEVSRQVARINPRSTELRLSDINLPREMLPVVKAINATLDRLDHGFRMQREFTADAAHELRTPLAVLAAHLDSLEDKQVAAALGEDVDRMGRLVGQLLSVAQLEALDVAVDETADLHAIAVDVAASLAPIALRRSRSVAVSGEPGIALVRGNAEALRQAVRNLVENALQHTPPDTTVEVAVSAAPALQVTDRGPGVPASDRERLFERFWRGRRSGDGAGLGLAIVQRIVAAHGGSLTVDDAPGGGGRFTIQLPRPAAL
jgi:signal transduction histidine kinase